MSTLFSLLHDCYVSGDDAFVITFKAIFKKSIDLVENIDMMERPTMFSRSMNSKI